MSPMSRQQEPGRRAGAGQGPSQRRGLLGERTPALFSHRNFASRRLLLSPSASSCVALVLNPLCLTPSPVKGISKRTVIP